MSTVITVTNQKGGVGKTTTAINVAFCLAKMGKKTLLVDLDPQGNATSGLAFDKQDLKKTMTDVMLSEAKLDKVVQSTKFKNLSIAPTTAHLANSEVNLSKAKGRFTRLKSAIEATKEPYDFIIIDSPPSLGLLTVNGLIASNYVLIPVQTEFYALEGVSQLLESMKLVRKAMNPELELLGVVPTMVDSRTTLSVQVLEEVKKFFGDKVFKAFVPRNVRLAEAPSHGVPIGVYDRFSKGSKAYRALTKEILQRVER